MACDEDLTRRYPHMMFSKHWAFDEESVYLLGSSEGIVDAICLLPVQPEHYQKLLRVSLIKGAQATTAIEGNTLTDAEVERVSAGEKLPLSKEYQEREVKNILEAMNTLLSDVAERGKSSLINEVLIKRFHKEVGKELGEHFDAIPGQFRTDERVVGPYRCPRPQDVEALIACLCAWLPTEFEFSSGQQTFAQAVVEAIVTHVYVEWIHPFGDGNGRTGRLLEFYILLRGGNPDIASHILSNYYNETRTEYYRQLDQASKTRDLSAFLKYAIRGYYDGLKAVLATLSTNSIETAWKYLVYSKFAERPYRKKQAFKRLRRLALALPHGRAISADEAMMLTPDLAREYAQLTARTLMRDMEQLREMNIAIPKDGKFEANLGLLAPHMARRTTRAQAALAARDQDAAVAPPATTSR